MYIHKLSIVNFRNYKELDITLPDCVNIFYGDNAQGKTNLLEAIYMCSTGRSQRAVSDRELIAFDSNGARVRVLTAERGHVWDSEEDYYENRLEVRLGKDMKKAVVKSALVNGSPIRKLGELFGVLLVVAFSPEDLKLVKEGPSARRRFMDMELCQLSAVYCHDLQQYHRVLKQRNNLLRGIKSGVMPRDTLFLWDEQLVGLGAGIIKQRTAFIERISTLASVVHSSITNGAEHLEIVYRPNVTAENFHDRLRRCVESDVAQGTTGAGVHKDDLAFIINGVDARAYGSQGQQRTASLSAKLAEIDVIREEKGRSPVLLLDDVMSELDAGRQSFLMNSLAGVQALITCTGVEDMIRRVKGVYQTYKVTDGKIETQ